MGLGLVSDLGVGRGEGMSLEAGMEDGEGLGVTNMYCIVLYAAAVISERAEVKSFWAT